MTISLLGMLMILLFIGIGAYFVVDGVSKKVTGNVDSGAAYDQLAQLKSSYSSLNNNYNSIKTQVSRSGSKKIKKDYVNAELELVKAQSAISDVESALSTNQPQDVVDNRLNTATNQLQKAKTSLNTVTGQL